MADTPTDGTPETPATKPAPRRRTRSASATTPKSRRTTPKAASESAPAAKTRAKPGPKPKPKAEMPKADAPAAESKAKTTRKPRATPAKRSTASSGKPKSRAKLIAGVTAAVIGVGGAIAAVVGRKKIVAVSGDVMEAVSAKVDEVRTEAGPTSGTIEVPSQSPVPPVS